MESIEAETAIHYATECYSGSRVVYGGSCGVRQLRRLEAAHLTGGGSLIFAVEFGTKCRLLFHAASFEMYTVSLR